MQYFITQRERRKDNYIPMYFSNSFSWLANGGRGSKPDHPQVSSIKGTISQSIAPSDTGCRFLRSSPLRPMLSRSEILFWFGWVCREKPPQQQ